MESEKVNFFNKNREKLAGNLYFPTSSHPTQGVIFLHCFTCTRHTRILIDGCQQLFENGIVALRFDFSGNGQSEGNFADTTCSNYISEVLSAIHYLRERGVSEIGLVGHSIGAAISILAASLYGEIRAICTLAGRFSNLNFNYLMDPSQKGELEQSGKIRFISRNRELSLNQSFFDDLKNHNLPEALTKLKQPLLAVHGEKDLTTPVKEVFYCQKLKPDNTEVLVLESADHMFSEEKDRRTISNHLTKWFKNQLRPHPYQPSS